MHNKYRDNNGRYETKSANHFSDEHNKPSILLIFAIVLVRVRQEPRTTTISDIFTVDRTICGDEDAAIQKTLKRTHQLDNCRGRDKLVVTARALEAARTVASVRKLLNCWGVG